MNVANPRIGMAEMRPEKADFLFSGELRGDARLTNRLTPHPGPLPVKERGRQKE